LKATLDSTQSSLLKANQRCAKLEDHLTQSQRDASYSKSALEQAQIDVNHWKAALEQSQNDAAQWKAALHRNSTELALLHKDRDHDRVAHDRLELELEQKEEELKVREKKQRTYDLTTLITFVHRKHSKGWSNSKKSSHQI
jgi:chromosome segregation ATPase